MTEPAKSPEPVDLYSTVAGSTPIDPPFYSTLHVHAFTVPVEYKYGFAGVGSRHDSTPETMAVTVLRCTGCDEEVKRG